MRIHRTPLGNTYTECYRFPDPTVAPLPRVWQLKWRGRPVARFLDYEDGVAVLELLGERATLYAVHPDLQFSPVTGYVVLPWNGARYLMPDLAKDFPGLPALPKSAVSYVEEKTNVKKNQKVHA